VSFNLYIVTLSVFKTKISQIWQSNVFFVSFLQKNIRVCFFYLVMSLTNYENGVAMVKRLGTTGLSLLIECNFSRSLFAAGWRTTSVRLWSISEWRRAWSKIAHKKCIHPPYTEWSKSHATHIKTFIDGCNSLQLDWIFKHISLWLYKSPCTSCYNLLAPVRQLSSNTRSARDVFFTSATSVHCWTLPGISLLLNLPEWV
jgi:hypothetical protein